MKSAKAEFDTQSLFSSSSLEAVDGLHSNQSRDSSGNSSQSLSSGDSKPNDSRCDITAAVFRPGQLANVGKVTSLQQTASVNDAYLETSPQEPQDTENPAQASNADDSGVSEVTYLSADVAPEKTWLAGVASEGVDVQESGDQSLLTELGAQDAGQFETVDIDLRSPATSSNLMPLYVAVALFGVGSLFTYASMSERNLNLAAGPQQSKIPKVIASSGNSMVVDPPVPFLSARPFNAQPDEQRDYFDFDQDRLVPRLFTPGSSRQKSAVAKSLTITTGKGGSPTMVVPTEDSAVPISGAGKPGKNRQSAQSEVLDGAATTSVDLSSVPSYRRTAQSWKAEITRLLERDENMIARIEYRLLRRSYPDFPFEIDIPR